MTKFNKETSDLFYGEHIGKPFFPNLQQFITSDVVVGMQLVSDNAIQGWRNFIGPTNTQKAQQEAPRSIRAVYGTDGTKNAVHGSDSIESAARELDIFFGDEKIMKSTGVYNNCSLCIIKPHIIKEGLLG